jgi:hypothetical protein
MTIVLCQTCKGRLKQAEITLPENLKAIQEYDTKLRRIGNNFRNLPSVEIKILVVDYACPDGAAEKLKQNYSEDILSKKLSIIQVKKEIPWEMSVVKNLALRAGSYIGGDYLVSLDIDNFVTAIELVALADLGRQGIAYHGLRKWHDGTCGRIGLPKSTFFKLNGFREDSPAAGVHDIDLVGALYREEELAVVRIPALKLPLQNTKNDTIRFTKMENVQVYQKSIHSHQFDR